MFKNKDFSVRFVKKKYLIRLVDCILFKKKKVRAKTF